MENRSHCPVACTLDLIGDRWTLLVIRDLIFGKHYFDEFLASPEGIATNILAARLKFLEEEGLAISERDPGDRRRVRYELTERGKSLRRLLAGVARWGLKNIPGTKMGLDD